MRIKKTVLLLHIIQTRPNKPSTFHQKVGYDGLKRMQNLPLLQKRKRLFDQLLHIRHVRHMFSWVTLKKPQKNEKLKNTLVSVQLNNEHTQVIRNMNMHTCIKTKKQLQALVCTCGYRPDEHLAGCYLVFLFFGGFPLNLPLVSITCYFCFVGYNYDLGQRGKKIDTDPYSCMLCWLMLDPPTRSYVIITPTFLNNLYTYTFSFAKKINENIMQTKQTTMCGLRQ